jgi:hypothetical protein
LCTPPTTFVEKSTAACVSALKDEYTRQVLFEKDAADSYKEADDASFVEIVQSKAINSAVISWVGYISLYNVHIEGLAHGNQVSRIISSVRSLIYTATNSMESFARNLNTVSPLETPDLEKATPLQLQLYISFSLPVVPFAFFIKLVQAQICRWESMRQIWNTLHQFSLQYRINSKPCLIQGKLDESDFIFNAPPDSEDQVTNMKVIRKNNAIETMNEKRQFETPIQTPNLIFAKNTKDHSCTDPIAFQDTQNVIDKRKENLKSVEELEIPVKKNILNKSGAKSILGFLETADSMVLQKSNNMNMEIVTDTIVDQPLGINLFKNNVTPKKLAQKPVATKRKGRVTKTTKKPAIRKDQK